MIVTTSKVFALSFTFFTLVNGQSCQIELDNRSQSNRYPAPIIFDWTSGLVKYPDLRQDKKRVVTIDSGKSIGLSCHATPKRSSRKIQGEDSDVIKLDCWDRSLKDASGSVVDAAAKKCNGKFDPEIRLESQQCAPLGADGRSVVGKADHGLKAVSIGWMLPSNNGGDPQLVSQIDLCIDNTVYGTLWTKHVIQPTINFKDVRASRPKFEVDTYRLRRFFGAASWHGSLKDRMYNVYAKKYQVTAITNQLGQNEVDGQAIIVDNPSSQNYLAKGHLSPDASMVYDFEQKATYYFINVAPQFQAFNNGNWKYLEGKARKLAEQKKKKLTVYQGTQDILTYRNVSGEETELYARYKSTSVPIPLYFWKVIHDEETNRGVGFIGVNDILVDEYSNLLCDNVCEELPWIGWTEDFRFDNFVKGRMSCCALGEEFKTLVDVSPDLSDENNNWPALLI